MLISILSARMKVLIIILLTKSHDPPNNLEAEIVGKLFLRAPYSIQVLHFKPDPFVNIKALHNGA